MFVALRMIPGVACCRRDAPFFFLACRSFCFRDSRQVAMDLLNWNIVEERGVFPFLIVGRGVSFIIPTLALPRECQSRDERDAFFTDTGRNSLFERGEK